MNTLNVLGFDYGAGSGRCFVGKFDGVKLNIEEVHRFQNRPVVIFNNYYWDILSLFGELKNALIKAKTMSLPINSIGIDSWASDYALIDSQGNMLGNPHHYRDMRTDGIQEKYRDIISEYEFFLKTGMEPHQRHTLYQLLSMMTFEKSLIEKASKLLFIPGILSYFLTGNISCDVTQASSSLLYNPFNKMWIKEFLTTFGLPDILPEINETGHIIGNVISSISEETGIGKPPVILTPSHDTASAIVSVPADKSNVMFINCGTWSVIGTLVDELVVNEDVFKSHFNNEIGYDGEILFVKNLTGLWIIQECINEWANEGYKVNFIEFQNYACKSFFDSYIDIEYHDFSVPGCMPKKITDYCRNTLQELPKNKAEIYMCIMKGLSKKYNDTKLELEMLSKKKFDTIHIIGGGARDSYLCNLVAKDTGTKVIAGPFEATVIGNITSQLISLGELKDKNESLELIKKSFTADIYS